MIINLYWTKYAILIWKDSLAAEEFKQVTVPLLEGPCVNRAVLATFKHNACKNSDSSAPVLPNVAHYSGIIRVLLVVDLY